MMVQNGTAPGAGTLVAGPPDREWTPSAHLWHRAAAQDEMTGLGTECVPGSLGGGQC